jgi:hypothetical protein
MFSLAQSGLAQRFGLRRPRHPGWSVSDRADAKVRNFVRGTDWTRQHLTLEDPRDMDIAAHAVALGGVACYGFANIYVFGTRPTESLVRYVNLVKGRPADQTGSVVTTPERIAALFDWSRLPDGLDGARVRALIRGLLELGPFGFRGPARGYLPHYLTQDDNGVRTVQVVSPGLACPSNYFFARVLEYTTDSYLYGTSANRSRRLTGADDEPVHHRLAPLQPEFGRVPGFFMLGQADDDAARLRYPHHEPMSATVLSFHKLGPADGSRPRVVVERHGSLALDQLRAVAEDVGLGLHLAPGAQRRLEPRVYGNEALRAA